MPPDSRLPFRPRPRRSRQTGFSLVEIAVVTAIIGLLAAAAMPVLKRTLVASRASTLASDLRTFAAAFQTYEQQNGRWPPDTGTGVMPPLMTGSLDTSAWTRLTPIGGYYNWEYNRTAAGVRYRAGIGVRTKSGKRVTTDRTQLVAVDRLIDDGNLATGSFFIGVGNEPFLALER